MRFSSIITMFVWTFCSNHRTSWVVKLVCVSMLFQACMVSQYRVIETKWQRTAEDYAPTEFNTDQVSMRHWSWGEQGRLKIGVENTSDSILHIDLFQCFLAIDSSLISYVSDTSEFPVYYGFCAARSAENWTNAPLDQETCARFISLPKDSMLVFTKFVLHPYLRKDLNCEETYGESVLFEEVNSPARGTHGIGYFLGKEDTLRTIDHSFYVSAKRKWIMKQPNKVYAPENRANNYYIRAHTVHPLGTFFMLAVFSLSIHLGTSE